MKEYILVEFMAIHDDRDTLINKLYSLGNDFQIIHVDSQKDLLMVSGRIYSVYASTIKLQDSFLAERMRIFYIPEDLKNQHRK